MRIYSIADAIICPIGLGTSLVFNHIKQGHHALKSYTTEKGEMFVAAKMDEEFTQSLLIKNEQAYWSRFEHLCINAIHMAAQNVDKDLSTKDTIFILSSTKGNIEWLNDKERLSKISLHAAAKVIGDYFKNPNEVICVSNACISGSVAQIVAKRLLEAGYYKHAVVIGCDTVNDFVTAGFASFQALSDEECRPFDSKRKGLNIGEAAACIILSSEASGSSTSFLSGGAITNDANHLSGPSKTGTELAIAITKSMVEAEISDTDVSFISAHGTATVYNDEMEAKAFNISKIATAPTNSFKSYLGHTLGASGIIETLLSIKSMEENILIPSRNFEVSNTTMPVNIITTLSTKSISHFVKTAAGFGGCNASLIWSKI